MKVIDPVDAYCEEENFGSFKMTGETPSTFQQRYPQGMSTFPSIGSSFAELLFFEMPAHVGDWEL